MQGCAERTVSSYIYNIDLCCRWLAGRSFAFATLTDEQVGQMLADWLGHLARATVMNRLLALRSYSRYLVRRGLRADDPTLAVRIHRDKLLPKKPFLDEEIRELTSACWSEAQRTLILFLLGSGCRRDEASRLRVEDIDWKRQRVMLHGKGSKERWVAPGAAALAAIERFLNGRNQGRVFDASGHAMYQWIKRIAFKAGVVDAHPHRFRATLANRYLNKYRDIEGLKLILGHEDIKTTEIYATFAYQDNVLERQAELDLGAMV